MSNNKKQSAPKKSVVPTVDFTLTKTVSISGKEVKKGQKVKLTKAGAEDFLSKHRISQEEYLKKRGLLIQKSK